MKSFRRYLTEMKLSLQYHNELNPKLWSGDTLKPEVRTKLLNFAYTWADFAKLDKSQISDIIMVGGNANYNYTSKSDIDVHIVIDRNSIANCNGERELVDEYLQDKKVLWTLTHNVKIYGYSIEPYAQDPTDRYPANQGIYSLSRNSWVQYPTRTEYDFTNDIGVKRKVSFYTRLIDTMIRDKMDMDAFSDLKQKIRDMRGAAIAKGGEFSFENLVFKELRNRGYLDKMTKYEKSQKDQELSLK